MKSLSKGGFGYLELLLLLGLLCIVVTCGWFGYTRMQRRNDIPDSKNSRPLISNKIAKGKVYKDSANIWAGYVAYGKKFNLVEGRVKVPKVVCHGQYDGVAAWVGFDGYNGSETVEQIGISGDCVDASNVTHAKPIDGATYYAWSMLFGAGSYDVLSLTIRPNDVIYYRVKYLGSLKFELTIKNETTIKEKILSYTCKPENSGEKNSEIPACPREYAEWIVERSGNSSLAEFDDLKLFDNRAIDTFGRSYSPYNLDTYQVDMMQGGKTLASTGSVNAKGDFTVQWVQSGVTGE